MKIVISINTAWNVVNFRSNLIRAMIFSGHEVFALCPSDEHVPALRALGCAFIPLPVDNQGLNPFNDIALFFRYIKVFLMLSPDVYLGYTIKPNVYGSLAAKFLGIPYINNVAGLGTAFINESWVTKLVQFLYRFSLTSSSCVFFQNSDDRDLFIQRRIVSSNYSVGSPLLQLLPGSGVDLKYFQPRFKSAPLTRQSSKEQNFMFLFIGRVLRDKGVVEFVDAARIVRSTNPRVRFCILGFIEAKNRTVIKRKEVDAWVLEGVIDVLGEANDVRESIAQSDCVVLPSYREGTPRSLLEAAAMAKPVIATDVAGCREVVDDEINGFLCEPYSPVDLADKMNKMIDLSPDKRELMGILGRLKIERELDEQIVIEKYLEVIDRIDRATI